MLSCFQEMLNSDSEFGEHLVCALLVHAWSFHALSAHPGRGSAHLSCRATWMLPDGGAAMAAKGPAAARQSGAGLGEHGPWNGDLRHLERDIATMR